MSDFAYPLCSIVGVWSLHITKGNLFFKLICNYCLNCYKTLSSEYYLKCCTGNVVDTRENLHRLFKHHTEGISCAIAAEASVVLPQDCVAVCVNDLSRKSFVLYKQNYINNISYSWFHKDILVLK